MRLFLCGFMGAGKSTVGLALSKFLKIKFPKIKFVDTDLEIERLQGKTIAQIFEQLGEKKFRELERDFLLHPPDDSVLALGGGSLQFTAPEELKKLGRIIYLQAPLDILVDRLTLNSAGRPLIKGLSHAEIQSFVEEKMKERELQYKKADLTVQTGKKNVDSLVLEIVDWLNSSSPSKG